MSFDNYGLPVTVKRLAWNFFEFQGIDTQRVERPNLPLRSLQTWERRHLFDIYGNESSFFSQSRSATASLGRTRFDLRLTVNGARVSTSGCSSYLKVSLHGVRRRAPFSALVSYPG